jgi:UDP-N-acetylmuramoyl-tripeptide--D-alanyl-D-alanine ligase
MTLADVAAATGGYLTLVPDPQTQVTGSVVTDSREVAPGSLFVARPGKERDGHDFAAQAVQAGAVAVLAQRRVGVPAVVVDDSELGLGRLARAVVDRLPQLTIIGVTGSSGKTTTKDVLAQVLAPFGPLVAPPGSFNNEVGAPLTVLGVDESTRGLIVELGARGVGHIRYLCGIAPPTIGVVLNVGSAHLGEFGDRDTIARAKGELVEALPPDGIAILNADDQVVRRMADRTAANVLMVGESMHADVRAEDVTIDGGGRPSFTLATPTGSAPVMLAFVGRHYVANALAAAGVAHALGMSAADIADRVTAARPQSRWRMQVTARPDGVTIINDAYNANPESVRAALTTLAGLHSGGRTWAVLGEMLELGEFSAAEHEAIGRLVARLNVSRLVAVADGARPIHDGAASTGSWVGESVVVPDIDAALDLLEHELRSGDVVLVKSSRDAGLRQLGDRLAHRENGSTPLPAGEAQGDR